MIHTRKTADVGLLFREIVNATLVAPSIPEHAALRVAGVGILLNTVVQDVFLDARKKHSRFRRPLHRLAQIVVAAMRSQMLLAIQLVLSVVAAAHMVNGCQSGCNDTIPSTIPSTAQSATALSSSQEPVITAALVVEGQNTGPSTTNGTCGSSNGGTHLRKASLRSIVCGNTTSHCGAGCQSGPCNGPVDVPAPGPSPAPAAPVPGSFDIVGQSGVPAMHAGVMPNGRVIFLDKVENYTQIKLGNGQYAYSAEYDLATNTAVGLQYKTNAFCSGGAFLPDGRWLSLGGNGPLSFIDDTVGDGFTGIRYLERSATDPKLNGQGWNEPGNKLSSARWYASAQTMSDGSIFVASGSLNGLDPTVPANNNPTYEVLNNQGISNGVSVPMEILAKNQPYYMYPFLHLLNNGSLFVFVSKSAELFDISTNTTVKTFPDLPGDYRTYPNTGTSVLLPLSSANNWAPDIVICGGGAYQDITSPTDPSCGRIQPLSPNATWEMDSMPEGRGMVDGTLLPDGTVIFLNGCNRGAQGFGLGADPTLEALIYNASEPLGRRFTTGASSTVPRLYHSVALLLPDATVLLAGSNPVEMPVLNPVAGQPPSEDYVTEFRVEIYTPPYLQGGRADLRPTDVRVSSARLVADGGTFNVTFTPAASASASASAGIEMGDVSVVLYHGGFVTHSLHMGQRMAVLDTVGWTDGGVAVGGDGNGGKVEVEVRMPPSGNVLPPGPYLVFVLVDGVPGQGVFVSVG
ncbi:hypothetical protein MMC06_000589 [Schaereria dolodes]|nr:hypothetical protein [Schaereria dolodes]